jgi:phosphoglycolate phosphatase
MKRLVIFDWDGTLMDSTGRIVECMQRAAADLSLAILPGEEVRGIIGLGLPEAIRTLYPHIDDDGIEAMRARYAHHFVEAEATPSAFFPGAIEVLETLRAEQRLLAVATGKSRKGLERIWQAHGWSRYFHASRCSDESGSKPHPAMIHELLEELSVAPHEAVVVGDTSFDLEMAAAAGVDAVAVSYGAHPPERLQPYGPLAMLERIDDLLTVLGHTARPRHKTETAL